MGEKCGHNVTERNVLTLGECVACLRDKLKQAYQHIGEIVQASERAGIRWYENEDGAECAENQAKARARRLEERIANIMAEVPWCSCTDPRCRNCAIRRAALTQENPSA